MSGISTSEMAMLPVNADGRLYHLGLKKGELAPRILTMGDYGRAARIAEDSLTEIQVKYTSDRGFSTWTGYFQGVLISIISIGMGLPMMDFLIREARTIVDGPMAIIRFGTCGSLSEGDEVGSLCVSTASCLVTRNPDYFIAMRENKSNKDDCSVPIKCQNSSFLDKCPGYCVSGFEEADPVLTRLLLEQLSKEKENRVITGLNASADSFYSSQGRIVGDEKAKEFFHDANEHLIKHLTTGIQSPVRTLEMETFQLYHLANCSTADKIFASGVMMIVANRPKNLFAFCDARKMHLEQVVGRACLESLSCFDLNKH